MSISHLKNRLASLKKASHLTVKEVVKQIENILGQPLESKDAYITQSLLSQYKMDKADFDREHLENLVKLFKMNNVNQNDIEKILELVKHL